MQVRRPDLLVYFTDAAGKFPALEPEYLALWLVKGHRDVPWGQQNQLNSKRQPALPTIKAQLHTKAHYARDL